MSQLIILAVIAVLVVVAIKLGNRTDIPKVKGLPELPGVPFFGSLILLGKHHARNAARLAKQYGDVFQVRLGIRRIIYANSFNAVKDLWIKNQSALSSRPRFWTFHDVVSTSQGVFTLGTSPWNDSIKRARKAAATALNRQAVQTYLPFIDLESTASINELLGDVKKVYAGDIDPNGYFQRFSLNISLTLNYGIRIQGNIHDHILEDVIATERELGNIRGVAHCWQDYIPLLRLWPGVKKKAHVARAKRDQYILTFYSEMVDRIKEGTDRPCIAGNCVKDPEAKLTADELKTICLTMVAAGLDTLPGNINMTIAYLSSSHGQEIQRRAHDEITATYPNEDPWHACLLEEKSEYMRSFVKEVLRYWSTLNMSFTRESIKPIAYNGAVIPSGTPFFMNMWAANHDPSHFLHPHNFVPERFMDVMEEGGGTQHFAYGAGTRMCAGVHLANRELYAVFTRLILAFRFEPTMDQTMVPCLDSIDCNAVPTSFVTQPRPFKVRLVPRNEDMLRRWIGESLEKTAELK